MPGKINFIRSFFSVIVILFCIPYLHSQDIINIRFEQEGKKINIYYDITFAKSGQKIEVKVYCSEDGGQTWGNPLKSVTGAVGKNQTAGFGKKITWDVLADREKLTGDIKFQVRAIVAGGFEGSSGVFSDSRDRKTYKWVRIGTQIWMAENLNYYTISGSWCYDDKSSNCEKFGRLYIWENARKVCPYGWHLPSDTEWTQLTEYLGSQSVTGGKLKETGTTHWNSPNTGATNESDFTALPSGHRTDNGASLDVGNYGCWWSSTESSMTGAWGWYLYYNDANISRYGYSKELGFSVRCVRDY